MDINNENNPEPVICFICLQEGKLLSSNIHCGETIFHEKCMNDYCKSNTQIICPICHADISDKFEIESKKKWKLHCNLIGLCKYTYNNPYVQFIVFLVLFLNIQFSFDTYTEHISHMDWDMVPMYIANVLLSATGLNQLLIRLLYHILLSINYNNANDYNTPMCPIYCYKEVVAYSAFVPTVCLTIMSYVFIYYPDTLSPYDICATVIALEFVPIAISAILLICCILSEIKNFLFSVCEYCSCISTESSFVVDRSKCKTHPVYNTYNTFNTTGTTSPILSI